jgi:type I restriction enzyme R subunit
MLAVVEAKAVYKKSRDGLQQAKEYAQILDLQFAYGPNSHGIVEHDFLTGRETDLEAFPSPDELWSRLQAYLGLTRPEDQKRFPTPSLPVPGKTPRYYQEIAINRTIQALLQGRRRVLLTMATGTGKTDVAFHICWRLWSARWNRIGEARRPRILDLSDRSILVDDPKDKQFAPFGDARWKIEGEPAARGERRLSWLGARCTRRDGRRGSLRPAKGFAQDGRAGDCWQIL